MKLPRTQQKGFTIFFATLIASLALSIGLAIYDVTVRQLDLSTTVSQSQYAIFAADAGAECALYWDSKYGGSGTVFPSNLFSGSSAIIYLTSGSSWTVPDDWNNTNNSIEAIGGGGGGGGASWSAAQTHGAGGGGGGGYAAISNVTLTPGHVFSYHVGAGGTGGASGGSSVGDGGTDGEGTWIGGSSFDTAMVAAAGGAGGSEPILDGGTGGAGGSAAAGIGTVRYSGGKGGTSVNNNTNQGSGGGGAGGVSGNGVNGFDGTSAAGKGGAGDSNNGGAGGNANLTGDSGSEWDGAHGSGGGGGGGQADVGGTGGLYGGGGGGGGAKGSARTAFSGGDGRPGIIAIRYNRVSAVPTNVKCGSYDIVSNGTPPTPYVPQGSSWSPWTVDATVNSATTTFTITFPGYEYCAKVEVGKVLASGGTIHTTIFSHGFNTCVPNRRGQLERELKTSY